MFLILRHLSKSWKLLVNNCNELGIPLPLIRDPKTNRGDVALSLVILSSIYVQAALIGKWAGFLGGVDAGVALNWFYSCCALYWARKVSTSKDGTTVIEAPAEKPPQP